MPLSMQRNSKTASSRRDLAGIAARLADRILGSRTQPGLPGDADINRIVVIKPCCLGDMLMATPVIRTLAQRYPQAEITIVTGDWTQPAIETSPRIDRVIRYPETSALRAAAQLGWLLRGFSFDLGISLDRSPATALALRIAGIPIRAGIDSESRGIGLTHRANPQPDQHETDLYRAVLQSLGFDDEARHPEYYVPDSALQHISTLIPSEGARRLVVIHPGGAVNPGVAMLEKRWPATSYGELASLLAHEANATIVLVGTNSDRNAVDTVRDFARAPVVDLCGQLDLPQLAALCTKASLYIGNDSGATHLASAVGTPVVAIFGPTNPTRYRPLGRRTRVCAPSESWSLPDPGDLRSASRTSLPDIASVPLPSVLNACIDLLEGAQP